jgi:hypothetical protein
MFKIAAFFAFFQASVILLSLAGIVPMTPGDAEGVHIFIQAVEHIVILVGYGIAMLNRRLWAAYALIAYLIASALNTGSYVGATAGLLHLAPALVYILGALSLARVTHLAPSRHELRWRSILLHTLLFGSGIFVLAIAYVLAGYSGEHSNPSYELLVLTWAGIVFALATRLARPWALETALSLTATVAVIDLVLNGLYSLVLSPRELDYILVQWSVSNIGLLAACVLVTGWSFRQPALKGAIV